MQVIMLIVLLFYLLPFVAARSNSITPKLNGTVTEDGKICEQLLQVFWKMKDITMEEDYQLITTDILNSKTGPLNQLLSAREHFVDYQRESK